MLAEPNMMSDKSTLNYSRLNKLRENKSKMIKVNVEEINFGSANISFHLHIE